MAVSDFIRQCRRCGAEFRRTAKGQPTKYCSAACRDHVDPTPEKPDREKVKRIRVRDRKRWPRHGRPAACNTCGRAFRSQQTRKTQGGWTRFCSTGCYQISRTVEADRLPRLIVRSHHGHCEACGKHYRKASKCQRYCGEGCRPSGYVFTPRMCECAECGAEFETDGSWSRTCSDTCKREMRRRHRRVSKAKRRAVTRGRQAERIDPIKVFERDSWRCQLCHRKLRPEDRGTTKHTAPELDHVIPLAVGGTHTWGNVQCACRACNIGKGAKPMGQIQLPMAA